MPILNQGFMAKATQISEGGLWPSTVTPSTATGIQVTEQVLVGGVHRVICRLSRFSVACVQATHTIGGSLLFTFPRGIITVLAATLNLGAVSGTATAFTAGTVNFGLGSVIKAVDAATLATATDVDMLPSTAATAAASVTGFTLPVVADTLSSPTVAAVNGGILPTAHITAPFYLNALTNGVSGNASRTCNLNFAANSTAIIPAGITSILFTGFIVVDYLPGPDNT